MIFTDGWWSSNDIHETINYYYDQIFWEISILLKLSYDLPHEPLLKFMSSHDLVPIRDKLTTGSQYQTLCECSVEALPKHKNKNCQNIYKTIIYGH